MTNPNIQTHLPTCRLWERAMEVRCCSHWQPLEPVSSQGRVFRLAARRCRSAASLRTCDCITCRSEMLEILPQLAFELQGPGTSAAPLPRRQRASAAGTRRAVSAAAAALRPTGCRREADGDLAAISAESHQVKKPADMSRLAVSKLSTCLLATKEGAKA